MKFLVGMASVFAIAASGVYLIQTANTWTAQKRAEQVASAQLCAAKKAEAAIYRGSMAWTGVNVTYKTGEEYCTD